MFHPILTDKLGGDAFKLFRQVVFRRRAKPLSEGLSHRRLMLRAKLPQEGVAGIFPQAGVGNVEHIPKPGFFAGIVHKGDALGTAPHIPAHGVVPEVIFRTGRCIRALGEDHKLLMEGVLRIFHFLLKKKAPGTQHGKSKGDGLPLSSIVLFVPIRVKELFSFFVCYIPFPMIKQIIYPKAHKRKRKGDPAVEYVRRKIKLDLWQKAS